MSRHRERFVEKEFEDEDYYRRRKGAPYDSYDDHHYHAKPNWKRLWLDHQDDYESRDEFFAK